MAFARQVQNRDALGKAERTEIGKDALLEALTHGPLGGLVAATGVDEDAMGVPGKGGKARGKRTY